MLRRVQPGVPQPGLLACDPFPVQHPVQPFSGQAVAQGKAPDLSIGEQRDYLVQVAADERSVAAYALITCQSRAKFVPLDIVFGLLVEERIRDE